jgi:hypothetical protein
MARTAHLRAADADRERTASELGRHYAEGRLTAEELSDRLEVAYSARTLGELAAVVRDLPAPSWRRRVPRRARVLALLGTVALVLGCALAGTAVLEASAQEPLAALTVLVLLLLCVVVVVAVLLPVVVALAPVVMVVLGARWVARELGVGRSRPLPPARLRANRLAAHR